MRRQDVNRAAPRQVKVIKVVGAAIEDGAGRVLLCRRPPTRVGARGMWEFPGGKIEPGESAEGALAREIDEELGRAIEVGALIARGWGPGRPAGRVRLSVYRARFVDTLSTRLNAHDAARWVRACAIDPERVPPADRPAARALQRAALLKARARSGCRALLSNPLQEEEGC